MNQYERSLADWTGEAPGNDVPATRQNTSQLSALSEKCKPKCKRCGRAFKRDRLEQKYCCARCRNAAAIARLRKKVRARSGDISPARRHLPTPYIKPLLYDKKSQLKQRQFLTPNLAISAVWLSTFYGVARKS